MCSFGGMDLARREQQFAFIEAVVQLQRSIKHEKNKVKAANLQDWHDACKSAWIDCEETGGLHIMTLIRVQDILNQVKTNDAFDLKACQKLCGPWMDQIETDLGMSLTAFFD